LLTTTNRNPETTEFLFPVDHRGPREPHRLTSIDPIETTCLHWGRQNQPCTRWQFRLETNVCRYQSGWGSI